MLHAGAIGGIRKVVAGLLVLAMFAVSAAPAITTAPVTSDHHAAHDCGLRGGDAASATAAVPAQSDHGQPDGGGRHEAPPGLACCIAFQCPMLLGGLPVATVQPLPAPGLFIRSAFRVRAHVGIDIAPALPPPREAV